MALAKATVETEAVHKEDSETETDDGSSETKEADMTAVAKATAETEAVLKQDSAGFFTAVAKATVGKEALLKRG